MKGKQKHRTRTQTQQNQTKWKCNHEEWESPPYLQFFYFLLIVEFLISNQSERIIFIPISRTICFACLLAAYYVPLSMYLKWNAMRTTKKHLVSLPD